MNSNMAWLLVKVVFPLAVAAAILFGIGLLVLGVVYATGYRNESEPSIGERLKLRAKGLKLIAQGSALLLVVTLVTVSFFRTAAFGWVQNVVAWATVPDRVLPVTTRPASNPADQRLIDNVAKTQAETVRTVDATAGTSGRVSLEPADMRQFVARLETLQSKVQAFESLKQRYDTVYRATSDHSIQQAIDDTAYRQRRDFGKVTDPNLAVVQKDLAALPAFPVLGNRYSDLASFTSRIRDKISHDSLTLDDVRAVPQCLEALAADSPRVYQQILAVLDLRRRIYQVTALPSLHDSSDFLNEVQTLARNAGLIVPDRPPVPAVVAKPPAKEQSVMDLIMAEARGEIPEGGTLQQRRDRAAAEVKEKLGRGTIREDLKPFTDAGSWQPDGRDFDFSGRGLPISLFSLKEFGALEKTEAGLQRLASCTVTRVQMTPDCGGKMLTNPDQKRTRWKLAADPKAWTKEERERLQRVQDFINEYMYILADIDLLHT